MHYRPRWLAGYVHGIEEGETNKPPGGQDYEETTKYN